MSYCNQAKTPQDKESTINFAKKIIEDLKKENLRKRKSAYRYGAGGSSASRSVELG